MLKVFKKALAVLLVLVILGGGAPLAGLAGLELPELNFFSAAAEAETSGVCGTNITWAFDESTGELTVSGTGEMTDWPYLSAVPWYSYRSSIVSIKLSDGITNIGDYAFAYTKIKDIYIPDGVARIGEYAFSECHSLRCLILPDSVTYIGVCALYQCYNFEFLHLPADFEYYSFFPRSYSDVTICADADDGNAKAVADREKVEFVLCNGHTEDETNGNKCGNTATWTFDEKNGVLEIKGSGRMYDYYSDSVPWASLREDIRSFKISDRITSIGDYAFYDCDNITEFSIPDSVTAIEGHAFSGCDGFRKITIPDTVKTIGYASFSGCENLINLTLEEGITSLGDAAFYGCSSLVSVIIPGSITEIKEDAFSYCDNLTYATFLEGIESTGKETFYGCDNLISVTLPDSLKTIGSATFYECEKLKNITLPENLETIGASAFAFCYGLKDPTFPDSLRTICKNAFGYCFSLKNIKIPAGVTTIEPSAFTVCFGLESITVDENNPNYSSDSAGILYNKDKTELMQYPLAGSTETDITIPETVTAIGEDAFTYCGRLRSVTIPVGVTSIGIGAFDRCIGLEKIKIPHTVTSIGAEAFFFCDNLRSVIIPEGVTRIEGNTFADCDRLEYVHIPESVTYISDGAFRYSTVCLCSASEDCYAKSYADESINSYFSACKGHGDKYGIITGQCGDNLTFKLDVYTEVLEINGTGAMWNWFNTSSPLWADYYIHIKTVLIGDGVTSIGDAAFAMCRKLENVTIGKNVASIGKYAFSDSVIQELTIPDSVTSIDEGAFFGCTKLKSLIIPDSVKTIGKQAFAFNGSIETLVLGKGVTSIGKEAFLACSSLENITILDAEVSIGNYAFTDCRNLESINFGKNTKSIGTHAFVVAKKVKSIEIPDSVTSIGEYAFAACESLEKIHLPAQLDNIGTGIIADTNAYICAESDNCYAKTYAEENGTEFRVCGNHSVQGSCGENITWTLSLLSGELVIKGTGAMYDYASFNKVPWYSYRSDIRSAVIDNGVTHISDYAFYNCRSLDKTVIPESVTSIGYRAFYNTSDYNVYSNWENGVFYLNGKYLIDARSSVSGFYDVKDGTKIIASGAFEKCTDLTSITIPQSVTDIGDNAFYTCDSLTHAGYEGTEEEWNRINIGSGNENLTDSVLQFTHSHSFLTKVEIPPTCTQEGRGILMCECGAIGGYSELSVISHVSGEWVLTEPDCVTDGKRTRYCNVCGNMTIEETIKALGHDIIITNEAVEATCTETGLTIGQHCSRCDNETVVKEIVPALGHDIIIDEAVAPTCTETGLTEGQHCSRCDEATVEQETVLSLGHDAVIDKAVAPTCTESGLTEGWHCTRCDYRTGNDYISALGHDMVSYDAVEPDCTNEGVAQGRACSRCDYKVGFEVIPAINHGGEKITVDKSLYPQSSHNYGNSLNQTKVFTWSGAAKLTITFSQETMVENNYDYIYLFDGSDTQIGKYTGSSLAGKTITIPGETFKIKLTSDGSVSKYGYSFSLITAQMRGFSEWETVTPAGCLTDGTEKRVCELCGAEETRKVLAQGHKYNYIKSESNLTRPTETSEGYYTFVCEVEGCGLSVTEPVERADYSYYNAVLAKLEDYLLNSALTDDAKQAASDSFRQLVENNDSYDINGNLRADLIKDEQAIVDSAASDVQLIVEDIERKLSDDEFIKADYSEIDCKIRNVASQISGLTVSDEIRKEFDGITAQVEELKKNSDAAHAEVKETLADLSEKLDEILMKIESCASGRHLFVNYVTVREADCVNTGIRTAECDYGCGAVTEEETPAIGHDIIIDEAVEPSCTQTGLSEGQHCSRCDGATVEQEETPALGHDIVIDEAVEPSCTQTGLSEGQHCSRCDGATVEQEETPALGHDIIIDEAVEPSCTQTGLSEGQHCSRCDGETVEQETVPMKPHAYTVKYDTDNHWKECACGSITEEQSHSFVGGSVCACGFRRAVSATVSIRNNNGSKTVNYGDTLGLAAVVTDKPAGARVCWYVDGVKKGEGEVFNVSFESGTKTVEVKLVDENGIVYKDADGNEVSDSEKVTFKAGFFQKLISFFKNLFGSNRTVIQAFRTVY